jgi:predicted nucleic acid-binding protein
LLKAAGIRAATGLKLPDAIHSATAEVAGCRAVLTNDREMKAKLGDMCFLLDDYLTEK